MKKGLIHKIRQVGLGYDNVWCGKKIYLPNPFRPYYRPRTTHYWNNVTCRKCLDKK